MERYQERLTDSENTPLTLNEKIEAGRDSISDKVLRGEIDILASTVEMEKLAREAVASVVEEVVGAFHFDPEEPPFALFFFGSPSRNLMLPNSDLDIGLVFSRDCPEDVRAVLKSRISSLPFDKVDVASWSSIEDMRKENCVDMIEYSKATDARFVAGNPAFLGEYVDLVRDRDTEEDKINRFITEFGLLHRYDYLSKKTDQGFNLKYDFGASRDVIFLDWFYLLKDGEGREDVKGPFFMRGLDELVKGQIISAGDHEALSASISLILLVKFTLLSKFRKSGNDMLLRLSNYSLHECYDSAPSAFMKLGIEKGDDLIQAYYGSKLSLNDLVETLYSEVSAAGPELRKTWSLAEERLEMDDEVAKILEAKTWYNLIPFAICSKSPQILNHLIRVIHDAPGYEYVLRVASENRFLDDETKRILLNSRLADKFKKKLEIINI